MPTDYYKVLSVDPRAEADVIRAAYGVLAARHGGERRKRVEAAAAVLLDAGRRADYDRERDPKGRVIGPYRILAQIAEGGFGRTYQAEHVALGSPVCVKHALNISAEDEALLLDEARAIWDLRHFGIPAIRDVLRMPDGSVALVMSYVPGPTLAQILEKNTGGLDPEHVAWITERVLNVLKYLHMHGVVHGDMKPQNIIVQAQTHTVVLVDYGLAAVKPTRASSAKGYTPYFAAPEQLGGGVLLPETDLYGLGMTMIHALGGDVEHVKLPATTPPAMTDFIKSLVRRQPLARPRVWEVDLCETIKEVRQRDFGRTLSGMKPLRI